MISSETALDKDSEQMDAQHDDPSPNNDRLLQQSGDHAIERIGKKTEQRLNGKHLDRMRMMRDQRRCEGEGDAGDDDGGWWDMLFKSAHNHDRPSTRVLLSGDQARITRVFWTPRA